MIFGANPSPQDMADGQLVMLVFFAVAIVCWVLAVLWACLRWIGRQMARVVRSGPSGGQASRSAK